MRPESLEQPCPIKLSARTGTFYSVCAGAVQHLKRGWYNCKTEFFISFHFINSNLNSHMWLPYWTKQLALEGPIKAKKAFCQKKILGSHSVS